jgi:hypothetical protein
MKEEEVVLLLTSSSCNENIPASRSISFDGIRALHCTILEAITEVISCYSPLPVPEPDCHRLATTSH